MGDRVYRRPVGVHIGRLASLGQQPRHDRLHRRRADVAAVRSALVQHARERRPSKVVRVDGEGPPHAARL